MMARHALVPVLMVALSSLGCSEPLGPVALDGVTLEFSFVSGGPATPPEARAHTDRLVVTGSLTTAMCGYHLSPSTASSDRGLDLLIDADFRGGFAIGCTYRYSATLRGLRPGPLELRLFHRREGGVAAEVAKFELEVR